MDVLLDFKIDFFLTSEWDLTFPRFVFVKVWCSRPGAEGSSAGQHVYGRNLRHWEASKHITLPPSSLQLWNFEDQGRSWYWSFAFIWSCCHFQVNNQQWQSLQSHFTCVTKVVAIESNPTQLALNANQQQPDQANTCTARCIEQPP